MSKKAKSVAEKRPLSRKLIEDLIRERQQMLVLLWELSKFDLVTVDRTVLETLEEFQEILVDYIAAGHFGLYQRIIEGNERRQAVVATAHEIYPQIAESTDLAVEFTERYDSPDVDLLQSKLTPDLSRLAESVTTRIELEDRLILAMLGPEFAIPQPNTSA